MVKHVYIIIYTYISYDSKIAKIFRRVYLYTSHHTRNINMKYGLYSKSLAYFATEADTYPLVIFFFYNNTASRIYGDRQNISTA